MKRLLVLFILCILTYEGFTQTRWRVNSISTSAWNGTRWEETKERTEASCLVTMFVHQVIIYGQSDDDIVFEIIKTTDQLVNDSVSQFTMLCMDIHGTKLNIILTLFSDDSIFSTMVFMYSNAEATFYLEEGINLKKDDE